MKGEKYELSGKKGVATAAPTQAKREAIKSPRPEARPTSGKSIKSGSSKSDKVETPRSGGGPEKRQMEKDPATKAKEILQKRIDMYKVGTGRSFS